MHNIKDSLICKVYIKKNNAVSNLNAYLTKEGFKANLNILNKQHCFKTLIRKIKWDGECGKTKFTYNFEKNAIASLEQKYKH